MLHGWIMQKPHLFCPLFVSFYPMMSNYAKTPPARALRLRRLDPRRTIHVTRFILLTLITRQLHRSAQCPSSLYYSASILVWGEIINANEHKWSEFTRARASVPPFKAVTSLSSCPYYTHTCACSDVILKVIYKHASASPFLLHGIAPYPCAMTSHLLTANVVIELELWVTSYLRVMFCVWYTAYSAWAVSHLQK